MTLEQITQGREEKPAERKIGRRGFLKLAGLGIVGTAAGVYTLLNTGGSYDTKPVNSTYAAETADRSNSVSTTEKKGIEYAYVFGRNIPDSPLIPVMIRNDLYSKKGFLEDLPEGLSKEEVFERLMKSPMIVETIMKYNGTGRSGLVTTNQDMLENYMAEVKRYGFTKEESELIEKFVGEEFKKSPLKRTLKEPIILGVFGVGKTLAKAGEHYLFPAESKIISRVENGQMSMEMWVNTNIDASGEPKYEKLPRRVLTKEETEVFDKFSRLRMKSEVVVPGLLKNQEPAINIVYRLYQEKHGGVENKTEPKEERKPRRFKRTPGYVSAETENQ